MDEGDYGQAASDAFLADAIRRARRGLPEGPGATWCEECGEEIPEKRRLNMPGCTLCVECKDSFEKKGKR